MLLDLGEIVEQVKSEYGTYQQSDRFLNQATSEVEDAEDNSDSGQAANDIPLLSSPLPPRDDDKTILTSSHILSLIDTLFLGIDELQRMQSALGIPGRFRTIKTLAIALASSNITSAKFHSICDLLGLGGTSLGGTSLLNVTTNQPCG